MNESANILVVDDDKNTLVVLTALLDEQGYKVRTCQNAEEALNHIVAEEPVEVVIADLRLPDGNGLKILWCLKTIKPDVAFIVITGYASVDTAVEAVNEGAFAYHIKPLDIDALNNSIRNALKQQRLSIENRDLLQRLQQTNEELEQASLAKTQILSTVTHELKTPLTSILSRVDRMLLQREKVGPLNERQHKYLETVQQNTRQLKALIDVVLDVSRVESGNFELDLIELDVRQEIEDVVRSMQDQISEQRTEVVLNVPSNLPRVKADRLRFSQVIGNLLSNAGKYSPAGATTTITAKEIEAGLVQIDVSDTGVGISKANQPRLFSKFFRVDNSSTREVSGTGLGLFITKYTIEAHGGRIWVESEEGKGSTFSVTLPTADIDRVRRGTEEAGLPPHEPILGGGRLS